MPVFSYSLMSLTLFVQEGNASHDENMQYLNLAVVACAQRKRGLGDARPIKRDSSGQVKMNEVRVGNPAPVGVPFGPHLIPVCCQQDEPRRMTPKDIHSSRNSDVTSQEACTVSSEEALGAKCAAATRLQQGIHACGAGLTQVRTCDCADGTPEHSSEDNKASTHAVITTNDLLDCLLHPDVISRVTELLLERHTGGRL